MRLNHWYGDRSDTKIGFRASVGVLRRSCVSMSGVGPVAKRRLLSRAGRVRTTGLAQTVKTKFMKTTAFAAFGTALALSQPIATGHLDATHLLGLDGPGSERWSTFLTASPAGSIHEATMHLDEARGQALSNTGVGQLTAEGARQAALAPASRADDIITGSIGDARVPVDQDVQIARSMQVLGDGRSHRLETPASYAVFEARRAPQSIYEVHPFERLELASLPTSGFDGFVGMIPPAPEIIVADDDSAPSEDAGEEGVAGSAYAMALVDPSAATSPLESTEGQQHISAFLNNDRQFQCLAEGVYFEARGETRQGQVAVAQVIMNRVNHDEFPDTICGVVYQNQHWRNRCQFSFACDGQPERITERGAWSVAEGVSRQVLEGRDLIETIEESTHYHAAYVRPRWAPRMIRLDRVGLHIFYKGRYGGWR